MRETERPCRERVCAHYHRFQSQTAASHQKWWLAAVLFSSSFGSSPSCTLCFAEALIVHDLTLSQEADHIRHIRIIAQTQDIIIRLARLLLGRHILGEVSDHVPRHADCRRRPRSAGCKLREHACRVVNEVRVVAGTLDLLRRHAACKLVEDRTDHLQVPQLFRTCRCG